MPMDANQIPAGKRVSMPLPKLRIGNGMLATFRIAMWVGSYTAQDACRLPTPLTTQSASVAAFSTRSKMAGMKWARVILRLVRLTVFTCAGAIVGSNLLWMSVLRKLYLYDHGFGEMEKSQRIAAVLGGAIGLGLDVLLGFLKLPKPRFSLRALLIATTLVAAFLGALAWFRAL